MVFILDSTPRHRARRALVRFALLAFLGAYLPPVGWSVFRPPAARPAVAVASGTEVSTDADTSSRASPSTRRRSDHATRLGVHQWQAAGYRGRGIKVAVLDSGFRGYRSHLGRALPERVAVRSFRSDENLEARDSQHGILCGEVVHALAPEAELLFANWEPNHPAKFLEAVRWARAQGAHLITCSVIMPNWSDGEGGGGVHAELARILGEGETAGDLLFFASAGNLAERHWCGNFAAGPDGFHAWHPGETENVLAPWGSEQVSVEVYGQAGTDYEVLVRDRTTGAEVGRAVTNGQGNRHGAVVRFQADPERSYAVRVQLVAGAPSRFHLVALHSGLQHSTARGSICFPGDGPAVIAVGAVDDDGRRVAYSSCGPNSAQPKPDLVAPVPFASLWRARPFSGTSAAAPQAAALAALWWSRHPEWTAGQVRSALCKSTRDLLEPGHDCETGYGLVYLP
jgi:subtilisin family serine protease